MYKRWASLVLAIATMATMATTVAAPAEAATNRTPGCVTRTEYRAIRTGEGTGMSQPQVNLLVGTNGRVSYQMFSSSWDETDREYRLCGRTGTPLSFDRGYVYLDFYRNYYTDIPDSYLHAESKGYSVWASSIAIWKY